MALTKEEAQGVTRLFIKDYPGALELAYKFRDNTAELYGPRAAEVPSNMKGGYISKETEHAGRTYRGRVEVPLQNMSNARDLLVTLRHEVIGHYGANTFTPDEKRKLLDGIIAARDEPSLKRLWTDIDKRYAGSSIDIRAEEVFALRCENVAPIQHLGDNHVQRGQHAFNETCLNPVRVMQADDLQNISLMVAQGLRDRSRTQQTFPATENPTLRQQQDTTSTAEKRADAFLNLPKTDALAKFPELRSTFESTAKAENKAKAAFLGNPAGVAQVMDGFRLKVAEQLRAGQLAQDIHRDSVRDRPNIQDRG
jgi:hypothetical protein